MSDSEGGSRLLKAAAELSRDNDWETHIAGMLEQELQRRGMSYDRLAAQLVAHGGPVVTALQLEEIVSKGDMSARLLLQIIDSLGADSLDLTAFYVVGTDKGKEEV